MVCEGLNGGIKQKSQKLEDKEINPNSMLGKTMQKRKYRRQFRECVQRAICVAKMLCADYQGKAPESHNTLDHRLEKRCITLVSTIKINLATRDDALPSSSTDNNLPPDFTKETALDDTWAADNGNNAACDPLPTDNAPSGIIRSLVNDEQVKESVEVFNHNNTACDALPTDVSPSRIIRPLVNDEQVEELTEISCQHLTWDTDDINDFGTQAGAMAFDETQCVEGLTQTQRAVKKTLDTDALTQAESVTEPKTEEDLPVVKKPSTSTVNRTYRRDAATRVINDSDAKDDNEVVEVVQKVKSKSRSKSKSKAKGKGKEKAIDADNDTEVKEKTKKRKRTDTDADVQGEPSSKLPRIRLVLHCSSQTSFSVINAPLYS
ncbi:hypothetical protein PQX77_016786 [Marasmius sp. AFHP31]|nr:hypothetical protein PQX77_016786 [Marasmius sp. AFHP31]